MPFDGNCWNSKRMLPYKQMLAIIRGQWPELQRLNDLPNDTSKVGQRSFPMCIYSLLVSLVCSMVVTLLTARQIESWM